MQNYIYIKNISSFTTLKKIFADGKKTQKRKAFMLKPIFLLLKYPP